MDLVEIENEVDEILELLVSTEWRERREAFEKVVVEVDLEEFPTILIARARKHSSEELLHLGAEEGERFDRLR